VEPEKKTAEVGDAELDESERTQVPFLQLGGQPQERYERLRAFILEDAVCRPQVNPAHFDLRRFNRFGLLGFSVQAWKWRDESDFEIEIVPIGVEVAGDRMSRLFELLTQMVATSLGGEDATSRAVRQGLDRSAGEGADDPEPACCGDASR
jgi:hypothetical protein